MITEVKRSLISFKEIRERLGSRGRRLVELLLVDVVWDVEWFWCVIPLRSGRWGVGESSGVYELSGKVFLGLDHGFRVRFYER
jgi:hypothetical protein